MANYQSTHTGAQIDEGVDKANKALVKPDSAPSATSLVAIDNTNAQTTLTIGDGLSVENGALKATGGGGGTQLYKHTILFNRTPTDRDELYIITNVNVLLNSFSDVEVWDFYIILPNSYIINDSGNEVYVSNCYISMERLSGVGYNRHTGAVEAIRDHDLVEGDITDTITPLYGVTQ